jgi:hypothetical protein
MTLQGSSMMKDVMYWTLAVPTTALLAVAMMRLMGLPA